MKSGSELVANPVSNYYVFSEGSESDSMKCYSIKGSGIASFLFIVYCEIIEVVDMLIRLEYVIEYVIIIVIID